MADMKDREQLFENKYAHDEELRFKVEMRRNKLIGLWAAELLGKEGDAATAYYKEVIESDFEEAGDDDVLRKVYGDLEAQGLSVTREEVRVKLDYYLNEAKQQIMSELE